METSITSTNLKNECLSIKFSSCCLYVSFDSSLTEKHDIVLKLNLRHLGTLECTTAFMYFSLSMFSSPVVAVLVVFWRGGGGGGGKLIGCGGSVWRTAGCGDGGGKTAGCDDDGGRTAAGRGRTAGCDDGGGRMAVVVVVEKRLALVMVGKNG